MRIISGEARGKPLLSPRDQTARPPLERLRESLFSVIEEAIVDRSVLDLFAGVGAFGLEAVSRGARKALFVERDASNFDLLMRNIERLGFTARCRALRGDALLVPDLSRTIDSAFGLVFLDPPFKMFASTREVESLHERIGEIRASPAFDSDGLLVVRVPAAATIDEELPAAESKRYGASKVLLIRKPRGERAPR